jgi:4a-hydroxytetrahydrobiopterin dehydratase
MTATEVVANLAKLENWRLCGDGAEVAIEKTFAFKDYAATMVFVNAIAWAAQASDHHPELLVRYDQCVVRLRTHDVGGLSRADFESAEHADTLVSGKAYADVPT